MKNAQQNNDIILNDLKYNYVIVGNGGYYLVGYHDIIHLPCVSYHKDYYDGFDSFVARQLVRLNLSPKVNKFIHSPFSHFVFPRLYPHHFRDNKPICYVFFVYKYRIDYLQYLRKTYPNVKLVLYMQDIVARTKGQDLNTISEQFDLLLSYDKGDATVYEMEYYPTPMSYVPINPTRDLPNSDIYFCGKGKDRYALVHSIYEHCTKMGLICDFHITDMSLDTQKIEGIHYNQPLSYIENLQHIANTKCILEIMQGGADGFTPRVWESIMYNKHLLTNNNNLEDSPYFYSQGHHNLESFENGSIIQWIKTDVAYPETLKQKISPINLLRFIDDKLKHC